MRTPRERERKRTKKPINRSDLLFRGGGPLSTASVAHTKTKWTSGRNVERVIAAASATCARSSKATRAINYSFTHWPHDLYFLTLLYFFICMYVCFFFSSWCCIWFRLGFVCCFPTDLSVGWNKKKEQIDRRLDVEWWWNLIEYRPLLDSFCGFDRRWFGQITSGKAWKNGNGLSWFGACWLVGPVASINDTLTEKHIESI